MLILNNKFILINQQKNKFTEWRVPKTLQWLVKLFLIFLLIFTAFRLATVLFFKPAPLSFVEVLPSFWLGLKYDLRWISIILLPILLLSLFPKFSPYYNERQKKIWTIYLGIITLLVLFFYGADFGQFAYVNSRLNADALVFAEQPGESLKMIWQSYPVIWILIGIAGAMLMMTWMFKRTHIGVTDVNSRIHKFDYRRRWHVVALVITGWFIYGFLTTGGLKFYRAFNLNDDFRSNLALNPMQNFFATLRFKDSENNSLAKLYYPIIENFLHLKNSGTGKNNYLRVAQPSNHAIESEPNIVLIVLENFSMYKSSLSGNPLNATPYIKTLAGEGIFFNRCFATSYGKARSVFGLLTGVPDVQLSKFATRNEITVKQPSIINDFTGYEKYYFTGGNSSFNNFKGLIKNIEDVKIFEEGSYKTAALNSWGIGDNALFAEANEVLKKQEKPFFAMLQTSGNQLPFTLPADDKEFVLEEVPLDRLKKYGFESLKEYQAFAYADYCLKKYMEAAQKENYFKNTIFVFVGNHGVDGDASAIYPDAWNRQRLTEEHVPLLFYAPQLLAPQKIEKTVSQIDVLPTVAGLIHQPYRNWGLGRNVLDSSENNEPAAFIMYHTAGWVGVVNNDFFYRKNIRIEKEELVSIKQNNLQISLAQQDSVKKHLGNLTSALYETARWMLVHNGK